tara:strand:- start:2632 stop:3198 length:567 start_codon:yes stop_codon:yes gene_type:complete
MIIENIFSNFLAFEQLTVNNDKLLEYANDQVKHGTKIQSKFLDLCGEPIESLSLIVQDKFNELHKSIGLSADYSHIIDNAWININNNINIDSAHCHPGQVFSAVYYVEANNDCGDLIFINPDKGLCHSIHPILIEKFNSFNSHNYRTVPKAGNLIIFPSHLEHYVRTNISNSLRVSIAFNSKVIKNHN